MLDLEKAQATGEPIGSREMLEKYGLNPKVYGSCSMPVQGANKGCQSFPHCRFREYRDGTHAPGNVGVLQITPQGAAANQIKACFQYYQAGDDAKRRRSDENGWVVKIVGLEGDTVKDRGSRMLHPQRDPSCRACIKGNCQKMKQYIEPRVIPPFPRLGDDSESTEMADFALEQRKLLIDDLDEERTAVALRGHATPPKVSDESGKQPKPGK